MTDTAITQATVETEKANLNEVHFAEIKVDAKALAKVFAVLAKVGERPVHREEGTAIYFDVTNANSLILSAYSKSGGNVAVADIPAKVKGNMNYFVFQGNTDLVKKVLDTYSDEVTLRFDDYFLKIGGFKILGCAEDDEENAQAYIKSFSATKADFTINAPVFCSALSKIAKITSQHLPNIRLEVSEKNLKLIGGSGASFARITAPLDTDENVKENSAEISSYGAEILNSFLKNHKHINVIFEEKAIRFEYEKGDFSFRLSLQKQQKEMLKVFCKYFQIEENADPDVAIYSAAFRNIYQMAATVQDAERVEFREVDGLLQTYSFSPTTGDLTLYTNANFNNDFSYSINLKTFGRFFGLLPLAGGLGLYARCDDRGNHRLIIRSEDTEIVTVINPLSSTALDWEMRLKINRIDSQIAMVKQRCEENIRYYHENSFNAIVRNWFNRMKQVKQSIEYSMNRYRNDGEDATKITEWEILVSEEFASYQRRYTAICNKLKKFRQKRREKIEVKFGKEIDALNARKNALLEQAKAA